MIDVKMATNSDAKILTELSRTTFIETFAKDNRKEDMDLYIAKTFGVDKQLKEIQDPKRRIAIAWSNSEATGFLHLIESEPDPSVKGPKPLEILRLYVDARWHGKGVGPALMEKVIQIAANEGFQTLWLGVWEHNLRAISFYRKYGFQEIGKHGFQLGHDNQVDLIMTLQVNVDNSSTLLQE